MSRVRVTVAAVLLALAPGMASAAGAAYSPISAKVDLDDQASLQRGAKLFVNYCLSCHSAAYMRYNRMGEDLGLTDELVIDNLMFASDKVGNTMDIAMGKSDAERWFGVVPPDLTVVARSRGPDWLYTYLMTFYEDASRPLGVNNLMYPAVGMPNVLESLQGVQKLKQVEGEGHGSSNPMDALEIAVAGERSQGQFSKDMRDLVNFMTYMGEPAKLERYDLGIKVIAFLLVLFFLSRALYKEYWKDVH